MVKIYILLLLIQVVIFSLCEQRDKLSCENTEMKLYCHKGLIKINEANYGRTDMEKCGCAEKYDCILPETADMLRTRCNCKKSCSVQVNNNMFGDPCPGIMKYLEVKYECL